MSRPRKQIMSEVRREEVNWNHTPTEELPRTSDLARDGTRTVFRGLQAQRMDKNTQKHLNGK